MVKFEKAMNECGCAIFCGRCESKLKIALCPESHWLWIESIWRVCVCVGVSVQLTKVWINSARSSKYTNKNIGEIALDKNIATTKSTAMEKNWTSFAPNANDLRIHSITLTANLRNWPREWRLSCWWWHAFDVCIVNLKAFYKHVRIFCLIWLLIVMCWVCHWNLPNRCSCN